MKSNNTEFNFKEYIPQLEENGASHPIFNRLSYGIGILNAHLNQQPQYEEIVKKRQAIRDWKEKNPNASLKELKEIVEEVKQLQRKELDIGTRKKFLSDLEKHNIIAQLKEADTDQKGRLNEICDSFSRYQRVAHLNANELATFALTLETVLKTLIDEFNQLNNYHRPLSEQEFQIFDAKMDEIKVLKDEVVLAMTRMSDIQKEAIEKEEKEAEKDFGFVEAKVHAYNTNLIADFVNNCNQCIPNVLMGGKTLREDSTLNKSIISSELLHGRNYQNYVPEVTSNQVFEEYLDKNFVDIDQTLHLKKGQTYSEVINGVINGAARNFNKLLEKPLSYVKAPMEMGLGYLKGGYNAVYRTYYNYKHPKLLEEWNKLAKEQDVQAMREKYGLKVKEEKNRIDPLTFSIRDFSNEKKIEEAQKPSLCDVVIIIEKAEEEVKEEKPVFNDPIKQDENGVNNSVQANQPESNKPEPKEEKLFNIKISEPKKVPERDPVQKKKKFKITINEENLASKEAFENALRETDAYLKVITNRIENNLFYKFSHLFFDNFSEPVALIKIAAAESLVDKLNTALKELKEKGYTTMSLSEIADQVVAQFPRCTESFWSKGFIKLLDSLRADKEENKVIQMKQ